MSKRIRHSDGSSHSEKKMGIDTQSEDGRARRKTSYTKDRNGKDHGQSGATPPRYLLGNGLLGNSPEPFTTQGPGLMRNGPLGCGPSTQGFGPPGCFSSKPNSHCLLGASSLSRQQFTTKGPGLLGAGPRRYEPLTTKGPGLLGNGPLGYEPPTTKGPGLLGNGPLGYEPSMPKGPGLLGNGPLGCEPSTTKGPGSAGSGQLRRESFSPQNPRLLEAGPTIKFPGSAGPGPLRRELFTTQGLRLLEAGPTIMGHGSAGTGSGLLEIGPTTKVPGLMGDCPPCHNPFTTPDPRHLGAGPLGCEPFTAIGHEPFTNYSSRLPSFSPVPVQTLNNNFAQGVSSESAEFRNINIAPGLKEEPHWKSQIRELKQYVVKLENDKCQMSEQVKKMNNYIFKLQSENSRLLTITENNNKIKNAIAGQIFKQHPQQLGEREMNLVVEKVYAKLKPQNLSPFGEIESTSIGNSYAHHSIQNQVSANSEWNILANKSVNDEDNEIQIIEPVKEESYDPYDHLDLEDLVDLLKNFKELKKSEQESLLAYMKKLEKKFPEKARILNAKYRRVM